MFSSVINIQRIFSLREQVPRSSLRIRFFSSPNPGLGGSLPVFFQANSTRLNSKLFYPNSASLGFGFEKDASTGPGIRTNVKTVEIQLN